MNELEALHCEIKRLHNELESLTNWNNQSTSALRYARKERDEAIAAERLAWQECAALKRQLDEQLDHTDEVTKLYGKLQRMADANTRLKQSNTMLKKAAKKRLEEANTQFPTYTKTITLLKEAFVRRCCECGESNLSTMLLDDCDNEYCESCYQELPIDARKEATE